MPDNHRLDARTTPAKSVDESGINYSMQIIENDGQYAENCVVKCDVSKGTKFDVR